MDTYEIVVFPRRIDGPTYDVFIKYCDGREKNILYQGKPASKFKVLSQHWHHAKQLLNEYQYPWDYAVTGLFQADHIAVDYQGKVYVANRSEFDTATQQDTITITPLLDRDLVRWYENLEFVKKIAISEVQPLTVKEVTIINGRLNEMLKKVSPLYPDMAKRAGDMQVEFDEINHTPDSVKRAMLQRRFQGELIDFEKLTKT